jgi:lysophospholipase L1-like esterase
MNKNRMKLLALLALVALASFAVGWFANGSAYRPAAGDQPSSYWEEKKSFFDTLGTYASTVMIGDSLTDGAEWKEMFPGSAVVNRGVDGDTTAGVLRRMDGITSARARKAFIMIGINDFKDGRTVDAVFQDYRSIVSRLEEGGMKVFVQSTLLCNESKAGWISCAAIQGKIRELNRRLAGLASAKVTYVDINVGLTGPEGLRPDLTYDGVHLNGEGYRIWRDEISKFILAD